MRVVQGAGGHAVGAGCGQGVCPVRTAQGAEWLGVQVHAAATGAKDELGPGHGATQQD